MENMKNRILRHIGLILMFSGMVGVIVTMVGMIRGYNEASPPGSTLSSASIAEDVSGALLPATIGSPLILIGLFLVLFEWWRFRVSRRQQT